jgi:hypothetical protein
MLKYNIMNKEAWASQGTHSTFFLKWYMETTT